MILSGLQRCIATTRTPKSHFLSRRIIADHIRTLTFALSDGITPGPEGRDYVLRRILRRAVRYGDVLGCPKEFFHQLVPILVEKMGGEYPELHKCSQRVQDILHREELKFLRTFEQGKRRFNKVAAAACADAGVFLISPFVGRILDWYKANTDLVMHSPQDDPGVQSVERIYQYYKKNGYETVVMGASFRNTGEIEALAGCDRLTISPALMEELQADTGELPRALSPDSIISTEERNPPNEADFRYALNDDAMATEKLAEGIRNFVADQIKLEQLISSR